MKRPENNPTEDDNALWEAVKATVKPLNGAKACGEKPYISLKKKLLVCVEKPVHDITPVSDGFEPLNAGDVHFMDKKTAARFSKGKMPVEARLDLHGYFLDDAFGFLKNFIYAQSKKGARCVLIITGKGLDGKSVIRSAFSSWMNHPDLRGLIVSFVPACPKDGGSGAFYVLLKRNK